MRATDFLAEYRKKKVVEPQVGDTTAHDYNPGWEDLTMVCKVGTAAQRFKWHRYAR